MRIEIKPVVAEEDECEKRKTSKFFETCSTCGNIRFLMLETKSMAFHWKLLYYYHSSK